MVTGGGGGSLPLEAVQDTRGKKEDNTRNRGIQIMGGRERGPRKGYQNHGKRENGTLLEKRVLWLSHR